MKINTFIKELEKWLISEEKYYRNLSINKIPYRFKGYVNGKADPFEEVRKQIKEYEEGKRL